MCCKRSVRSECCVGCPKLLRAHTVVCDTHDDDCDVLTASQVIDEHQTSEVVVLRALRGQRVLCVATVCSAVPLFLVTLLTTLLERSLVMGPGQ
jgi:hypothetical protein